MPFGMAPNLYVNDSKTPYWGTHLANKLRISAHYNRSNCGVGWNWISHQIEKDVINWSKDDIIIISPSFLERMTILEFKDTNTVGFSAFNPNTAHLFKTLDEIFDFNELRWRLTITNYQKLGFRVYTWLVNDPKNGPVENLLTAPDGEINWKRWMDKHHEYWISLPGVKYPLGDWHFNAAGHVAVAERMYQLIVA